VVDAGVAVVDAGVAVVDAGVVVVDAAVAGAAATQSPVSSETSAHVRLSAAPGTPSPVVTPLSPDRYKFQVTISGETLEKIRLAKDMLGHAVPSGDDAAILDRAFTALLTQLARKKFAETPRPKPCAPSEPASCGGKNSVGVMRTATRTVPAAVKRAVWVRDVGRCAFVGEGGHRCNERRFVEFHHVDPYALGGEGTVDGIALRRRSHNDYEGRIYFGDRRETRPAPVRGSREGKVESQEEGREDRGAPRGSANLFQNKLA